VYVEARVEKRYVRREDVQRAEAEGRIIEDTFELKIKKISLLENLLDKKAQVVHLSVSTEDVTNAFTDTLKTLAMLHRGQSALSIQILDEEHKCNLDMPSRTLHIQARPFIDGVFEKYPGVRVWVK
jgi:hypothetical protein